MRVATGSVQESPTVDFEVFVGGYVYKGVANRVHQHRTLLKIYSF